MSGDRRLLVEQNRVRGAISTLQRRGKDRKTLAVASRTAVRKALLEVRENLPNAQRTQFFDWFEAVSGSRNPALEAAIRSDLTSSALQANDLPFGTELEWVLFRTRPHLEFLKRFREKAGEVSDAYWARDAIKTADLLSQIQSDFGPSLWMVNAELAIRQDFDGLESQKDALHQIIKKYPAGLPAYIVFHISVRNEPQSSFEVFNDEFLQKIDKAGMEPF